MITDWESNEKDNSYLTKTIVEGELTSTLKIDDKM